MTLTCIECKNSVDLTTYTDLKVEDVIECNTCGITLVVTNIHSDGSVETEIIDEGK